MSRFAYPPGAGGSGYATIEDNDVAETQRTTLDVVGRGFTLLDESSKTKLRIGDALTMVYINEEFVSGSTPTAGVGALGWTFAGGSVSHLAGEANHPGILRIVSGAANPSNASLTPRSSPTTGVLVLDPFHLLWIARHQLNGGTAAQTLIRIGAGNDISATTPVDGVYFEKLAADTNWFAVTRAASTETRVDTTVAASANTWYRFRIRRDVAAGNVIFNLGAGADDSHSANIPTVALTPGFFGRTTEAVAKHLEPDYFELLVHTLTR